jgi:uncharacterized protein YjbJ (UPF0337 family)
MPAFACASQANGTVPLNHHYEIRIMNKDQVKGRIDEAKGKLKEKTGKVVDDKELELEGKLEKIGGKTRAGYGDLKEDIKDSI